MESKDNGDEKLKKEEQVGPSLLKSRIYVIISNFLILTIGILIGVFLIPLLSQTRTNLKEQEGGKSGQSKKISQRIIKYWTCSMHPSIKYPDNTRKCPICFMDLIPVYEGEEDIEENEPLLSLSKRAQILAEVETEPVLYRPLIHHIFMVGKVDYDESRIFNLELQPSGESRLEKMYTNFTGIVIKKGQHLYSIYSPSLIAAQGEYLAAFSARTESGQRGNLEASRRKLLDFGMTENQIQELEKSGKTEETTTIYSKDIEGTVVEKLATEGAWYTRGTTLLKVADLSKVWVKLDAYESDINWVRYGQEVTFETESYPGHEFKGRISFIDPFLNDKTRSVKVRVSVLNNDALLKPGMFVHSQLKVELAEGGKVFDPNLSGKWISPMHPEIIKDHPGTCDICGMELVRAEDLGYTKNENTCSRVLAIPYTAPLLTGKRAIVYVEEKKRGNIYYLGKEVKLGPRADDYYVVLDGLKEGEKVVVRGAFKIDASLQILGRPSMMIPAKEREKASEKNDDSGTEKSYVGLEKEPRLSFHKPFQSFIHQYLKIVQALAEDNADSVAGPRHKILTDLEEITTPLSLTPQAQEKFKSMIESLKLAGTKMQGKSLAELRLDFFELSSELIKFLEEFGHTYPGDLYIIHCPMYRGGLGGSWIQETENVTNPYYGSNMLDCGELVKKVPPLKIRRDK